MGDPLSLHVLQAFRDELLKQASIASEALELGSRLKNPIKGLQKGWRSLSPTGVLAAGGHRATDLAEAIEKTRAAGGQKGIGAAFRRTFGAGEHLVPARQLSFGFAEPKKGLVQRGAEALSRGGYTGEGKLTKYIPIGEKGQLVGAGLSGAYGVGKAMRYGPSEAEGGAGEQAGRALGYAVPGVLTAGMPLAGFVAPMLAAGVGARLGRNIDRRVDARAHQLQPGKANRLQKLQMSRRAGQALDAFDPSVMAGG